MIGRADSMEGQEHAAVKSRSRSIVDTGVLRGAPAYRATVLQYSSLACLFQRPCASISRACPPTTALTGYGAWPISTSTSLSSRKRQMSARYSFSPRPCCRIQAC